jgi:ribosomal-protein-alanine N-acetyltransferase
MISLIRMTPENIEPYLERIREIETLSFAGPWSINAFRQEAMNPVSHLHGLFVNGALQGYMCFWLFEDEIQLVNIAVHPKERGRGLGRFLVTKMIELALSRATQRIWLEVRVSNKAARRLYEKFGFVEVGRRPKYYADNNEDAIVMALALAETASGEGSREEQTSQLWTTPSSSPASRKGSF